MSTKRPRYISDHLAVALRKLLADPTAREQAEVVLRTYDANHRKGDENVKRVDDVRFPIKIEDHHFATLSAAYKTAQAAGFDGVAAVFNARVHAGKTWAQCIAPVNAKRSQARKQVATVKRDEMALILKGMPK